MKLDANENPYGPPPEVNHVLPYLMQMYVLLKLPEFIAGF